MHYRNMVLLAIAASTSALPTGIKRDIGSSGLDLLDKRDPGLASLVKWGINKVTGPKADAVAKTCQAGFLWTMAGCVAQIAPPSDTKKLTLTGLVGGATFTTQDAASKWKKVADDAAKKKAEAEKKKTDAEHQLPAPEEVPPKKTYASTGTQTDNNVATQTTPNPPDRPATPEQHDPDEAHMPGHSRDLDLSSGI